MSLPLTSNVVNSIGTTILKKPIPYLTFPLEWTVLRENKLEQ